MDGVVIAAIVAGSVAAIGHCIAALVTHLRSRLEAKRIDHETRKWLLDLHAEFEKRLHEIRLQEYPAILAELERLSHFRISKETPESLHGLAEKFNRWGYGKAGMSMSAQTRDALFKLRIELTEFANKTVEDREKLMAGPRTDLIEWLRRDVGHSTSTWRNLPSLLRHVDEAVVKLGNAADDGNAI